MRMILAATGLLLGAGLAACSSGREAAPPPPGPPPAAAAPAAMAGAGGFEGHYVGTGVTATPGPSCPADQAWDFTVAANQVTGTVTVTGPSHGHGRHGSGAGTASADVTGTVDPSGHATLQLTPHGANGPRGSVTGMFANGTFTAHRGGSCTRDVTARMS